MTNVDNRASREQITLADVDRKIAGYKDLAHNPRMIEFDPSERAVMEQALKESGASIEYLSDTVFESLYMKKQFRGMGHSRGFGFVAILGIDRCKEVMQLCNELSVSEPRFKSKIYGKPTEWSRPRGHYQLAADLLVAALPNQIPRLPSSDIAYRMNRRLWKGAMSQVKGDKDALERLRNVFFIEGGIEYPDNEVARAQPQNMYPIWMAMTGRSV